MRLHFPEPVIGRAIADVEDVAGFPNRFSFDEHKPVEFRLL
jgi:hypothetical protein